MSERPSEKSTKQVTLRSAFGGRSLDVRDITGPKKNLLRRNQKDPIPNTSVFAGVRKGAADTISVNGGHFNKPDRNRSTAFAHLDLTDENYHLMLKKKTDERHSIFSRESTKADPAKMVIAGVKNMPEPFKI